MKIPRAKVTVDRNRRPTSVTVGEMEIPNVIRMNYTFDLDDVPRLVIELMVDGLDVEEQADPPRWGVVGATATENEVTAP
jgi:hypothetical protein